MSTPSLIAILIRYKKNKPWTIYKINEIQFEKEMIEFMKHCRKKSKENMLQEEYKIEYYAPI